MKKKVIITLIILSLSIGCIEQIGYDLKPIEKSYREDQVKEPSFKDLNENPSLYLVKILTVMGALKFDSVEVAHLEDENGYIIKIPISGEFNQWGEKHWLVNGRKLYLDKTYTIEGNFTFYEICDCQRKIRDDWMDMMYHEQDRADDCINRKFTISSEGRCKPGTVNKVYHLKPINYK